MNPIFQTCIQSEDPNHCDKLFMYSSCTPMRNPIQMSICECGIVINKKKKCSHTVLRNKETLFLSNQQCFNVDLLLESAVSPFIWVDGAENLQGHTMAKPFSWPPFSGRRQEHHSQQLLCSPKSIAPVAVVEFKHVNSHRATVSIFDMWAEAWKPRTVKLTFPAG